MNLHCTCEVAFQVRTTVQLYEAHRITRLGHNHDDCTRSAFITRSKYGGVMLCLTH